jgi:hypothetical protein
VVQELLNIEHFFHQKSKLNILGKLGQDVGVARKPLMSGIS